MLYNVYLNINIHHASSSSFDFFLAQRVLRIPYYFRQVRDHKLEDKDKSHSLRENVIQPMKGRIKGLKNFLT